MTWDDVEKPSVSIRKEKKKKKTWVTGLDGAQTNAFFWFLIDSWIDLRPFTDDLYSTVINMYVTVSSLRLVILYIRCWMFRPLRLASGNHLKIIIFPSATTWFAMYLNPCYAKATLQNGDYASIVEMSRDFPLIGDGNDFASTGPPIGDGNDFNIFQNFGGSLCLLCRLSSRQRVGLIDIGDKRVFLSSWQLKVLSRNPHIILI